MRVLFTTLAILFGFLAKAQDIHHSHVHASPLLLNPAMTGLFQNDMRFIADFRSQWKSVSTDYRTMYASMDMKTRRFLDLRGFSVGIGFEAFSDRAGDLDFRTYGAQASLSGIRTMGRKGNLKMMTIGFKAGAMGNSVDFTKIVAFDEEPTINEGLAGNRLYMDWSLGVGWFHEIGKRKHREGFTYYLGVSASHVNQPEVQFGLDANSPEADFLYRRFVVHGGGDFGLSRSMSLMPSVVFSDQGPHREIVMGTFWKHRVLNSGNKKKMALYLGVWGRWYAESDGVAGFDALIAAIRLNYHQTAITFSYDINTSSLALASGGRGGAEISIVQYVDWKGHRRAKVECPAFDY
jgi:type IX secretion system PorP/SprF family membrane protein